MAKFPILNWKLKNQNTTDLDVLSVREAHHCVKKFGILDRSVREEEDVGVRWGVVQGQSEGGHAELKACGKRQWIRTSLGCG